MPNTTEAYASNLFVDDSAAVIRYFKVKSPLYVGWSYGGTATADVFANLPPKTISGMRGIAALPTAESALITASLFTQSIITSFGSTDAVVDVTTRTTYIAACFKNASNIPTTQRWSLLGSSVSQPPSIALLLLQRQQDPTKLYNAGKAGLPYLAISGTGDRIIVNDNITQLLQPHFTDLTVKNVKGGAHALFVENRDEFIQAFIPFANKVFKRG